jgi:hypothetical protein
MTPSRLATVLTLSMICSSIASGENVNFQAAARDPGVEHWISYQILGPRNHPYPILYLSTRRFRTTLPEFIIVLPSRRYDILSAYTQERIVLPDCLGEPPIDDVGYTFEIAGRIKKRIQRCVLRQAQACAYLSSVINLAGINWTAAEVRPITDFVLTMRCKTPAR